VLYFLPISNTFERAIVQSFITFLADCAHLLPQVMDGFEMVRRYRVQEAEHAAKVQIMPPATDAAASGALCPPPPEQTPIRTPLTIIGVSANSDLIAQARSFNSIMAPSTAIISILYPFFRQCDTNVYVLQCVENCERACLNSDCVAVLFFAPTPHSIPTSHRIASRLHRRWPRTRA
jgi:hypothetical protein